MVVDTSPSWIALPAGVFLNTILHPKARTRLMSRDFLCSRGLHFTAFHGTLGASLPIQTPSLCRLS
ncbi:MAG TPA: hypothetical protein VFB42_00160 [Gaiellaceae bacterium]|nr:hypothetical protein [Gaiellaceae bacterium]